MEPQPKKHYILFGILVAILVHTASILIRELSPVTAIAPAIDIIALNPTWVYLIIIGFFILANFKRVREKIICLPEKLTPKTVAVQKLILGYEALVLAFLLIVFPAIAYFYSEVYRYTKSEYPTVVRFLDYMPITDVIAKALSSFPLFITFFVITSLLCFIMPHSYMTYKYAQKAPAPLQSSINFSIILSIIITMLLLAILALSISPWMIIALIFVGPIILLFFIIVNIMMLRYHNKFIGCDEIEL